MPWPCGGRYLLLSITAPISDTACAHPFNCGVESANNGIQDDCRSIDCATSAAPRIWRTSSAPADKPKGMHWRTYERKVASWTRAVERADEAFIR